jgi:hypothetical protein
MESKMIEGIRRWTDQGHTIVRRIHDGKTCWEIDQQTLASHEEVQNLANGIDSPSELIERHAKCRNEEMKSGTI